MIFSRIFLIAISASLASCAAFSPKDVANPSTLKIDDAMSSIGKGFYRMHLELEGKDSTKPYETQTAAGERALPKRLKLGLWPCKVTTTLNVTANASMGGSLVLDVTVKPPAEIIDASLTGKVEQKRDSSANRANAIIIEMYSAACIPEKTLGYNSPDKVQAVVEALRTGLVHSPLGKNLSPEQLRQLEGIIRELDKAENETTMPPAK